MSVAACIFTVRDDFPSVENQYLGPFLSTFISTIHTYTSTPLSLVLYLHRHFV